MRKNFLVQRFLNLIYNVPVLICAAAFAVSNMVLIQNMDLWIVGGLLLLCGMSQIRVSLSSIKERLTLFSVAVSAGMALHSGMVFFRFMRLSSKFGAIASMIGIQTSLLVGILGAAAGVASFFFVLFLTVYLRDKISVPIRRDTAPTVRDGKKEVRDNLVCLAAAAVCITICSKSSPLYPFNDWVDAHCFFTVGKSMLSGLLPYRDLYEQKGPVLYFLFALASLVNYKTFFGVYLLEIAAAWAFLAVCRKILVLYLPSASLLWVFVIGAMVYSARAFCQGGSAEELCLPLLTYCLYCGMKSLRTGQPISFWEGLWIGITSACVLWIKYTMLGLYIGWFFGLCVIRIREKRFDEVLKTVGAILLGVLILSAPILLFFWMRGGLLDLWTVYFYDNIFHYGGQGVGGDASVMLRLSMGNQAFGYSNPLSRTLLLVALLGFANAGYRKELLLTAGAALACFFFTFIGAMYFDYYSLVLSVFAPLGIVAVMELVQNRSYFVRWRKSGTVAALVLAGCMVFAWVRSPNTFFAFGEREEVPQVQFAEIIDQKENATLLNYGFLDGGFYTATGIVPNCRYFAQLNIPMEEMYQEQKRFLKEGCADFVVSLSDSISSDRYNLVAEAVMHHEDRDEMYYLYQLIQERD